MSSTPIEICQQQPPPSMEGEGSCLRCTHRWAVHGDECLACQVDAQGARLDVYADVVGELLHAVERGAHLHPEFPDFHERSQEAEEHIERAATLLGWQRVTPAQSEVNHPDGQDV